MPNAPSRVLVVDDNRVVADTMSTLVRLLGHNCERAYDGRTALELTGNYRPEVILLDLNMPDMDGFAVARVLRELYCTVKIVAMTGFSHGVFDADPTKAGFDAVLTKPVIAEELAAILGG